MSLAAADQYSQIRTPAGARKLVCNFPAVPPPAQPTLSPAQLTVNYDFPAAAAARWQQLAASAGKRLIGEVVQSRRRPLQA